MRRLIFMLLIAGLVLSVPAVAMATPDAGPASPAISVEKTKVKVTGEVVPAPQPTSPASQPVKSEVNPPVEPQPPIVESAGSVYDLLKAGKLREGLAALITLLVLLYRRYGSVLLADRIPVRYMPLVVFGLAFLGSIPAGLTTALFDWRTFIIHSLIAGAEAIAFWSAVLKFIFPLKAPPSAGAVKS